jgi:hypothetical protein
MTDLTTPRIAPFIAAVLVVTLWIATVWGAAQGIDCDKPLGDADIKELVAPASVHRVLRRPAVAA